MENVTLPKGINMYDADKLAFVNDLIFEALQESKPATIVLIKREFLAAGLSQEQIELLKDIIRKMPEQATEVQE